jgi:hypothetical protein
MLCKHEDTVAGGYWAGIACTIWCPAYDAFLSVNEYSAFELKASLLLLTTEELHTTISFWARRSVVNIVQFVFIST